MIVAPFVVMDSKRVILEEKRDLGQGFLANEMIEC